MKAGPTVCVRVLLQLPTQIYMAVLYAVLDLLLNFQHCFYNFWLKPRRKRKQQQQEATRAAAFAQEQQSDSTKSSSQDVKERPHTLNSEAATSGSDQLQHSALSDCALLQAGGDTAGGKASNEGLTDSAGQTGNAAESALSSFSVSSPAAHHLRALSAGDTPCVHTCSQS